MTIRTDKETITHLNIGGPRGWTTACGIESSSFVEENHADEVDCKRCLRTQATTGDIE